MSHHSGLFRAALLGSVALFSGSIATEVLAQQLSIEEITVTSRKREESLLEIPLSVTAFSQNEIDAMGINTLESLSAVTPGFVFQSVAAGGFGGRQNPSIRFRGLSVQQTSPASRAGAVFWDGGYVSDGAGILPLIDLERVEIIKGPQNAFFGRNTFAGAVNYIPAEPGDEFSGKGSVSYSPSNEDSYNLTAAAGGPLSDTVGLRVALMHERVGADFQFGNGDPLGEENTTAFTAVSTFQASEALSFKLSGFYVNADDTRIQQSQQAPVQAGDCNRTYSGDFRSVADGSIVGSFTTDLSQSTRNLFCGEVPDWDDVLPTVSDTGVLDSSTPLFAFSPPLSLFEGIPAELEGLGIPNRNKSLGNEYRLWRVDLSADYELDNGGLISAELTRGESTNRLVLDSSFGTASPVFGGGVQLSGAAGYVRDTYAELRYTSSGEEPLRYMIGTSYYEQDNSGTDYNTDFTFFIPANNLLIQEGYNFGIFGSIDYDVTDQLTVSLEGRWNEDEQTILYDGISITQLVDPNPITNVAQKYDAFMPRVIVSYQPTESTNIYANWSKSYLQGIATNAVDYFENSGIDLGLGTFTPRQSLDAFEVGLKQRATDWLSYSIAGFYMDWNNQTFFELSPTFLTANLSGDSRTWGVDFEFDAAPTDWLVLSGNVAYNDTEFTDFAGSGSLATAVLAPGLVVQGTQISSNGNTPRYISKWTGSLSATVDIAELAGLETAAWLRVDSIYTGQFYIDNFEWNSVPGYFKYNARLHADITKNFAVELYGNNLTNNQSHITAGGTTSIFGSPNRKTFAPLPRKREIGLKLLTNF